ncbi:vomeronasal type-2 receptor 26-like [Protopterus annectens]|uniref:vomeronasal type-2 receptor 26-like n=1 Tax=Protopterus annectens TaxID=7888 RepID=UPI001CFBA7FC|nr:vomeronasal type-2 receptor 26-like [Protopterus annectens]
MAAGVAHWARDISMVDDVDGLNLAAFTTFASELLHYVKKIHFVNNAGGEMFFDDNGDPPAVFGLENQKILPDGTIQCVPVGSISLHSVQDREVNINGSVIMWKGGTTQAPRSVCSEPCLLDSEKQLGQGSQLAAMIVFCALWGNSQIRPHSNYFNDFFSDATNCVKCPDNLWADDKRQKCIPKVKEFLTFADPLGASLTGISVSASVITVTVLCIFIKFRNTPIVKANNRELSYILLSALVLCFMCSLIFIGQPIKISCILRQTTFGIVFSICISSILAKTIIVVIAFTTTKPTSKMQKFGGLSWIPGSIIVFSSLLQIIICTVWLFIAAPFPENNMKSETGKIIIECNEGSAVMFYCMLGYLGLLAAICFVVAFLARNLPGGFNETKYITFSMLAFISVWLSFIPAYLSTKGKYTVAVEIFAILASSAGLLICIFSHKVFIILVRPDLNKREKLARK